MSDHTLRAMDADETREFPYEDLLAVYRQDPRLSATRYAEIERLVRDDPRWRAHWESVRFLDLEQAAAAQDGRDLGRLLDEWDESRATEFCRLAARTEGGVFQILIRGGSEARAGGWSQQDWSAHVDGCVYCRRMQRQACARLMREEAGLPPTEPLLRDWLLDDLYRAALQDVTERLARDDSGLVGVVLEQGRFAAVRDGGRSRLSADYSGNVRGFELRASRSGAFKHGTLGPYAVSLNTPSAPADSLDLCFERTLPSVPGTLHVYLEADDVDRVSCRVELERSAEGLARGPLLVQVECHGRKLVHASGDAETLRLTAPLPGLHVLPGTRLRIRVLEPGRGEPIEELALEFEE